MAPRRLTPFRLAPESLALLRLAPPRLAPRRSAPCRSALLRSAPLRLATSRYAWRRMALPRRYAHREAEVRFFVTTLITEELGLHYNITMARDERLPAIDSIESPAIELSLLADLPGTIELLRDVGAIE